MLDAEVPPSFLHIPFVAQPGLLLQMATRPFHIPAAPPLLESQLVMDQLIYELPPTTLLFV